jgi:hypothetical protein
MEERAPSRPLIMVGHDKAWPSMLSHILLIMVTVSRGFPPPIPASFDIDTGF